MAVTKAERAAYDRARYLRKKDQITANNKRWRASNKDRLKELTAAWRQRHPDRWVALIRKWQRKNPERMYQANVRRRAAKGMATPKWADHSAIRAIYAAAKAMGLEVDHCVPLNSERVCGLHWEGNLRLITKSENSRKGNRTWEDGHQLL